MYQITEEELPQEIIDRLVPLNLILRDKLIRKINETYQWHSNSYIEANSGDFSFIKRIMDAHIFHYC